MDLDKTSLFKNGIKITVEKEVLTHDFILNDLNLKIFDSHDNFIGIGEVVDIDAHNKIFTIAPRKVLVR